MPNGALTVSRATAKRDRRSTEWMSVRGGGGTSARVICPSGADRAKNEVIAAWI